MTEIDHHIAAVAARQHGVFSRAQAVAAGASAVFIRSRVKGGMWVDRARQVLGIAGAPDTAHARLLTAVLEGGDGALASHRCAAALHGLPGFAVDDVRVTRARGPAPPAPASDRAVVAAIPCTAVPRTLFDLAATEPAGRVERAMDNALAMRLTSVSALRMLAHRQRGRTGVALFRALAEARASAYVPPSSELEARFLVLVRAAGLPEPERQKRVGGRREAGRADMAWPSSRVVVELDSRRHHTARLDVEADVRRDVAMASGGWRVLRFSWEDVFAFPRETLACLSTALAESDAGLVLAMPLRAG